MGAVDLATIAPPVVPDTCVRFDCAPYGTGADAIVGHTYVILSPEGYPGDFVFVRITAVSDESVTLDYFYD